MDDSMSTLTLHFHPPPDFYKTPIFSRIKHQSYLYAAAYSSRRMSIAGDWAETVIFGGHRILRNALRVTRWEQAPPSRVFAVLADQNEELV